MTQRSKSYRAIAEKIDADKLYTPLEAVKLAKAGDIAAIRVCLDRITPRRRDRVVPFELPPLHSAASVLSARVLPSSSA